MFKVGDRVKVLRHRNYLGGDVKTLTGETVTLFEKSEQFGITEGFDVWETKCGWLVRSDDIELVSSNPVREVTRREIVPGTYGRVGVAYHKNNRVGVYIIDHNSGMTAEELDNVAMIASQLAEALRDV